MLFKYKKNIIVYLMCLISLSLYGQFKGVVVEKGGKTPMPFASVYIIDLQMGTSTDSLGQFSFTNSLPSNFVIRVSAGGFERRLIEYNNGGEVLIIELDQLHVDFDEITVSNPRGGLQTKNVIHIESRKIEELNTIPASNMGEMLQKIPGVYNASSGAGVSKPVVRGFQGVRVVTLLNGVRLENQQWGGDHDLGITDLGIGSVEVIKGPASLLYGADALGGVIYFVDEDYAQQEHYELKYSGRYESNSMAIKNQLSYKVAKKNMRLNLAGSYSNNADYQLPNGKYVANSRFNGQGAKLAFGANKKNWAMHLRYSYASSLVGIIGETEDSIVSSDSYTLDKQQRNISTPFQSYQNHLVSWENKLFKKKNEWSLLLGHSYNALSEFEDSFNEASMALILNNTSGVLKLKSKLGSKFDLVTGIQASYQMNTNKGGEEQLIPDAQQIDNGIYVIGYYDLKKWNIQGGMRYDYRWLSTKETFGVAESFSKQYGSSNFSLGSVRSGKKSTIRINVSSGFRVPHLSELLTEGEHHGALRYEIGNRELVSEKAFQLDLSGEIHGEHLELVINPFANLIRNYIYLNGTDSIIDDLPVYRYEQLKEAHIFGIDLAFHYHPHFAHWLHWESSYSYIYAEDILGGGIAFMPQARIRTSLRANFEMHSKFKIVNVVAEHRYHFDQNRIASYETPSRGYNVIDFGINLKYAMKVPIDIGIGVRNLLNTAYIDHLSRLKRLQLQDPGRNFYFSLKVKLEKRFRNKK